MPTARQRFHTRLVGRAIDTDAPVPASLRSRYADTNGLTWQELASLGGSIADLNAVALCLPPRADHFAEDVAAIAEGYIVPARLSELLAAMGIAPEKD